MPTAVAMLVALCPSRQVDLVAAHGSLSLLLLITPGCQQEAEVALPTIIAPVDKCAASMPKEETLSSLVEPVWASTQPTRCVV